VSKFPVFQVPVLGSGDFSRYPEGAIDKYWLDLPDLGRCLIKFDAKGAWLEKIVATLAQEIGLPVAKMELAQRLDGLKAIASPSYLLDNGIEVSGERLLLAKFGENFRYTPEAILSTVHDPSIGLPSNYPAPTTSTTASDLLAGYLIFDSWVGNVDRHSRNWGIQQTAFGMRELLPAYDGCDLYLILSTSNWKTVLI
jgi:hypothetical protein